MKKTKWIIVLLAVAVHLFFYYSAFVNHALDIFFASITQGQDFFQIPNAAYSFLQSGDLQGNLNGLKNAYISCCGVNTNVYHPFFTLLVGAPLQLFSPWTAFSLWGMAHFGVSVFVFLFLLKKFKNHRWFSVAVLLFLVNNYHYYEIWNNQYHFLLNLSVMLLLYRLTVRGDSVTGGLLFFCSLIVKPIGLLWTIPLIFQKKIKTLLVGLGLFAAVSLLFFLRPEGKYYFDNLFSLLKNNRPDWNIFYVLQFIGIPVNHPQAIVIALAGLLVIFSFFYKSEPFIVLFLWVAYSLVFYPLTFPYHYSILPYLISLGILINKIKVGIKEAIAFLFISLPAPIFLLRTATGNHLINNSPGLEKFVFVSWSLFGVILLSMLLIYNLVADGKR